MRSRPESGGASGEAPETYCRDTATLPDLLTAQPGKAESIYRAAAKGIRIKPEKRERDWKIGTKVLLVVFGSACTAEHL